MFPCARPSTRSVAQGAACAALLGLLACAGGDGSAPPGAGPDTRVSVSAGGVTAPAGPRVGTVVVSDAPAARWGTDSYVLNAADIDGDALTVNVSFGGGCEAHRFTLVVGESFRESYPVQVAARIAHEANGDACEAYLTEDHRFDLTVVRDRYRDAYGPGAGAVALSLPNAPAGASLVYDFP